MGHSHFESVIGLEVHCQLSTESKLFCSSPAQSKKERSPTEEPINSNTCVVCTAHPGTLPVVNEKAIKYAVKAGLALGCEIREKSLFARKSYFYPDLPKGYQISQYESPICENGQIQIKAQGQLKTVRIERIHLEEDAGKSVHYSHYSLVDLNRAGVPLIEIVSHPDLRTPEEASAYLKALHGVVTYLGICDGNMQEGNLRCDANVSIRVEGEKKLGTRTEIKNLNSFRFLEHALDYEIRRQIEVIQSGQKVVLETRGYDSSKNVTFSMRSKEEAHDYRYFPDPDLPPLVLEKNWIRMIDETLPELPQAKQKRYEKDWKLTEHDAVNLTSRKSFSEFFEKAVKLSSDEGSKKRIKILANLMNGEVSKNLNEIGRELSETFLQPEHLAKVVHFLEEEIISSTGAKVLIQKLFSEKAEVEELIDRLGIRQVSGEDQLIPVVDEILAKYPEQVREYQSGKKKIIGFFVGQAMAATNGQANPTKIKEILKDKLK